MWDCQCKRDIEPLELAQLRGTKRMKELDHLFYEERLRELGLRILETNRLIRYLVMCINT